MLIMSEETNFNESENTSDELCVIQPLSSQLDISLKREITENVSKVRRSKLSIIWNYYDDQKDSAVCTVKNCNQKIKNRSTTNPKIIYNHSIQKNKEFEENNSKSHESQPKTVI